jgi:hypothetical protein
MIYQPSEIIGYALISQTIIPAFFLRYLISAKKESIWWYFLWTFLYMAPMWVLMVVVNDRDISDVSSWEGLWWPIRITYDYVYNNSVNDWLPEVLVDFFGADVFVSDVIFAALITKLISREKY